MPVLDVWTKFWNYAGGVEENLRPLLSDGLHLTPAGYKVSLSSLPILAERA